jgi:hypothetical protein
LLGFPAKLFRYHFELARGAADNLLPIFDLAYIDGGHVYHLIPLYKSKIYASWRLHDFHDYCGPATNHNPSKRPATAAEYDPIQVKLIMFSLSVRQYEYRSRNEFLG